MCDVKKIKDSTDFQFNLPAKEDVRSFTSWGGAATPTIPHDQIRQNQASSSNKSEVCINSSGNSHVLYIDRVSTGK